MSLPQRGNADYAISKSSKEIYNQISSSATLDNRHSEDKENYDADTIIDDDDEIDLQSCLNRKRPDIFTRFEERKRCIAELKKLRWVGELLKFDLLKLHLQSFTQRTPKEAPAADVWQIPRGKTAQQSSGSPAENHPNVQYKSFEAADAEETGELDGSSAEEKGGKQ